MTKTVIKFGGSEVTEKGKVARGELIFPFDHETRIAESGKFIRTELLREISHEIYTFKQDDEQTIIINGAGPFGHTLVERNESVKLIHSSVKHLNAIIVSTLREAGLEVENYHPYEMCDVKIKKKFNEQSGMFENHIKYNLTNLINILIKNTTEKVVSSTYGDVIPIPSECLSIDLPFLYSRINGVISGDDLVVEIAKKWKTDRVIFIWNEDGVFRDYRQTNQELVAEIIVEKSVTFEERMRELNIRFPTKTKEGDVTGSAGKKIEKIYQLTQETGIPCRLVNGQVKGNVRKVLNSENIGTIIKTY